MVHPGVIYAIRCKMSDMLYIGSSKVHLKRMAAHFSMLRHNKHHCSHLQNAFNKYGEECFFWEILESDIPIKELFEKEQEHIDRYPRRTLYNVTVVANGSFRGQSTSEETKEKIRQTKIGKPRPASMIVRISGKNHYSYGKSELAPLHDEVFDRLKRQCSIREIAKDLAISTGGIRYYIKMQLRDYPESEFSRVCRDRQLNKEASPEDKERARKDSVSRTRLLKSIMYANWVNIVAWRRAGVQWGTIAERLGVCRGGLRIFILNTGLEDILQ